MAITPLKLVISDIGFDIINTDTNRPIFKQNNHPNNGVWDAKAIAEMGNATFKQYLDNAKQEVRQAVAANRYEFEVAGVTVNGITVQTDRESQSTVNAAYTTLKNGLVETIDWKGSNGWVQIDLDTIEFFAKTIAEHAQYCFSQERVHSAAIDELTAFEDLIAYNPTTGFSVAEKEAYYASRPK